MAIASVLKPIPENKRPAKSEVSNLSRFADWRERERGGETFEVHAHTNWAVSTCNAYFPSCAVFLHAGIDSGQVTFSGKEKPFPLILKLQEAFELLCRIVISSKI